MDRHHHRLRGREQRYQLDPQDRPCPIHVRRYHDRRHWSHRLHGGGLHPHHVRPRQPQRHRHRLRQRHGPGRPDPPPLGRHSRRLLPPTPLHPHACHAHTDAHSHTHGHTHGHAYGDAHGHT